MINKQTIFEIHRLKNLGISNREIAQKLNIDRRTVHLYLNNPVRVHARKKKPRGLDPYRDYIKELLNDFPQIKAPVVLQRIQDRGFTGEITQVRTYLRELRRTLAYKEPFIRFESDPGVQMQVDWGHFNALEYDTTKRKLYALAVIESHSRMLYVFFTHSQKQEVLHQGLINAFIYFGGTPKELVVDNMMTAVIERAGSVIRFNDAFLDFLIQFNINPVACNVRAPYEKGKIESGIKYLRNNFFPARKFTDLEDIRVQVRQWLDTVANTRVHKTTGQKPLDRLCRDRLTPLPEVIPDCRETGTYLVHKDFGVRFDGNVYTTPPWTVGKKTTLKADNNQVYIYYKDQRLALHPRCWQRYKRIENPRHVAQVKKIKKKLKYDKQTEVFLSLGKPAYDFIDKLSSTNQAIKKTIERLLKLKDEYGETSLLYAMEKAIGLNLYGAEYIENILYQEMTPKVKYPPVTFEKSELNDIRLQSTSLKEYDALALKRRKKR
jgi:transposase